MTSLAPIRKEILSGDFRAIYLTWLAAVQNDELDPFDREPTVPPGLGKFSTAQHSLIEFLRLDEHLVAAAAEKSAAEPAMPTGMKEWISGLPAAEKDSVLLAMMQGNDSHVGTKLLHRFYAEMKQSPKKETITRTVKELTERAHSLREAKRRKMTREAEKERWRQKQAAAKARNQRLDKLAKRQPAAWKDIESLVSSKNPKAYDEAVALLSDLKELSNREGRKNTFPKQFGALLSRHSRKSTFITRLKRAGLLLNL